MIAQIAIQGLQNRLFDYLIPDSGLTPAIGSRVRAQFGRKYVIGIVIAFSETSEVPENKLKALTEVLDENPILSADIIELCQWTSRYYHHSLSEVLFNALPVLLRKGEAPEFETQTFWRATDLENTLKANAKKQLQALAFLKKHGKSSASVLREAGIESSTLKKLAEKALVESSQAMVDNPSNNFGSTPKHPLNAEQLTAQQNIQQKLDHFNTFLLDGVTGSGKTEVYLSLMEQVLQQGKRVLVLVPEIGLTPQLVFRFEAYLQQSVACLHSGMNDKERLQNWLKIKHQKNNILVGTRSALFTPMENLGLIILDEEHDGSYKQQEGLRYHARDLAIVRAKQANVPVILGSATPSLESLSNALKGNYQHLKLRHRAGKAKPPQLHVIDCRQHELREGFSPPVLDAIGKQLKNGGQVMVFINRRGYAPSLSCFDCGWLADCPQCDVKLTLHRKPARLCCHHCGFQQNIPQQCPECSGSQLQAIGIGTQRSEDFLEQTFSNYPVLRFDRDKTRQKGYMQQTLETIREGEPCLIVGTQMLAKGHDFPQLNLVVIQDADSGLFSSDYRAAEKMGQTLLQVIGRAGRSKTQGHVYIQSKLPEHPYLMLLMQQNYKLFSQQLLSERQQQCLPPYFYQVLIRASSIKPETAQQFLQQLQRHTQLPNGVFLQGPWSAPIFRQANRYRYQCLLHSADRKALHLVIDQVIATIEALKPSSAIRWNLDIDPQDMS